MDFRIPTSGQVTCSDASTSGGGVCASLGLSGWGRLVVDGSLRGELPELRQQHQVLTIGLFDGIGALRVASDLIGLQIIGDISVENNSQAARVNHISPKRSSSRTYRMWIVTWYGSGLGFTPRLLSSW